MYRVLFFVALGFSFLLAGVATAQDYRVTLTYYEFETTEELALPPPVKPEDSLKQLAKVKELTKQLCRESLAFDATLDQEFEAMKSDKLRRLSLKGKLSLTEKKRIRSQFEARTHSAGQDRSAATSLDLDAGQEIVVAGLNSSQSKPGAPTAHTFMYITLRLDKAE